MPAYEPNSETSHDDGRKQKRGCLITFLVWLAFIGGLIVVGKLSPVEREKWELLTTVIWIGLIFIVPTVGILQAVELKPYLDWSSESWGGKVFYRVLIFLGCWLFGLIALGLALISIVSVLETEETRRWWQVVGVLVLTFFICGVGVFLLCYPFSRNQEKTEILERADWALYQQQLIHPDFTALEQQTGMILPPAYLALFNPESSWLVKSWTLYPKGMEEDEEIYEWVRLMPAHESSLRRPPGRSGWFLCFGEGQDIGEGQEESEFWIELGTEDPPVWLHFPDHTPLPAQATMIGEQLSSFLGWPKEES